jgi:predicted metal-binding protein
MTLPIEAALAARFKQVVFVCSKCMKKQDRKELRGELRKSLKAEGRKDIRVVPCGCLDVCPKHGVTIARPSELQLQPPRLHVLDNRNSVEDVRRWLLDN